MTRVALKLGQLKADGYTIVRSSVRWLRESGQMCLANQPIAYCNITLEPTGARVTTPSAFAEEQELQVALAPRYTEPRPKDCARGLSQHSQQRSLGCRYGHRASGNQ